MTEKPKYYEMGLRVTEARESTGKNQKEAAKLIGLEGNRYGHYERGTRKMPPHIMANFVKITGYSSDWLYLGIGNKIIEDSQYTQKQKDYIGTIDALNEKGQEAFDSMIESFASNPKFRKDKKDGKK